MGGRREKGKTASGCKRFGGRVLLEINYLIPSQTAVLSSATEFTIFQKSESEEHIEH